MADTKGCDADGAELERYLRAVDDGPFTTDFERLTSAGVELASPDALTDEQVAGKLWEVTNSTRYRSLSGPPVY